MGDKLYERCGTSCLQSSTAISQFRTAFHQSVFFYNGIITNRPGVRSRGMYITIFLTFIAFNLLNRVRSNQAILYRGFLSFRARHHRHPRGPATGAHPLRHRRRLRRRRRPHRRHFHRYIVHCFVCFMFHMFNVSVLLSTFVFVFVI